MRVNGGQGGFSVKDQANQLVQAALRLRQTAAEQNTIKASAPAPNGKGGKIDIVA